MRFRVLSTLAPALLLAVAAQAGVLMTLQSTAPGESGQSLQKVYLNDDRIRVEAEDGDDFGVVIFRQDLGVFWILDSKDKSYVEMTKADLEQLSTRMEQMVAMLQEQLQQLPPEQRQQVEQMMAGKSAKPPVPHFEKVASGEKVGDWTADKYEGTLDGVRQVEVWTADYREMGLKPQDFQVLEEMGKMFEAFSHEAASLFQVRAEAQEGHFSGIPVKTVNFSGGQAADETILKEIKKQDFKTDLFEVPEGYTKETMEEGMEGE